MEIYDVITLTTIGCPHARLSSGGKSQTAVVGSTKDLDLCNKIATACLRQKSLFFNYRVHVHVQTVDKCVCCVIGLFFFI